MIAQQNNQSQKCIEKQMHISSSDRLKGQLDTKVKKMGF